MSPKQTIARLWWASHRRLSLFWVVALAGLATPWLAQMDMPATEAACRVSSVHDGDTVRATCGDKRIKIRLWCIDTPEIAQRPWGTESRDALRALIRAAGGQVTVREHGQDRYGRVIGELIAGDHVLNVDLVRMGRAAVYRRYCPSQVYIQAERAARAERVGIWAKPGLHQRPWEYRHR